MIVETINRMARGMDYPSLTGPDDVVNLASNVAAPGTSWQNASYGMNGLGDFSVIGDYFTSTNYYLGYVAVGLLAYSLLKGGSKSANREKSRRASIKGQIAKDQALL